MSSMGSTAVIENSSKANFRKGSEAVTRESRLTDAVAPAGDTAIIITAAECKRELIRALIGSCRDWFIETDRSIHSVW
jgi:hypothetical protein